MHICTYSSRRQRASTYYEKSPSLATLCKNKRCRFTVVQSIIEGSHSLKLAHVPQQRTAVHSPHKRPTPARGHVGCGWIQDYICSYMTPSGAVAHGSCFEANLRFFLKRCYTNHFNNRGGRSPSPPLGLLSLVVCVSVGPRTKPAPTGTKVSPRTLFSAPNRSRYAYFRGESDARVDTRTQRKKIYIQK